MATFYILHSEAVGKYYIGFTDGSMQERVSRHLSDHKGFTSRAKDWIIIYTEEYQTKEEAHRRELQVKGWKSSKMVEKLISEGE
ncbi:MAG: GIY-YIG nuclease family protein [Salinivirgaceae bacterium]|jgi:putative endonuclease